mgnify:CR=1 FL=1
MYILYTCTCSYLRFDENIIFIIVVVIIVPTAVVILIVAIIIPYGVENKKMLPAEFLCQNLVLLN